jgi:hypothetical protein
MRGLISSIPRQNIEQKASAASREHLAKDPGIKQQG